MTSLGPSTSPVRHGRLRRIQGVPVVPPTVVSLATGHLARAKSYFGKAEASEKSTTENYRLAADELLAAKKADPTLSNRQLDRALGWAVHCLEPLGALTLAAVESRAARCW